MTVIRVPYLELVRAAFVATLIFACIRPPEVVAQDAAPTTYLAGNKLRVILDNAGSLQRTESDLLSEWPIGTGREYLDAAYPVVLIGSRVADLQPEAG